MLRSSEVLILLLKVTGVAIGTAAFFIAVFVLARSGGIRNAFAKVREASLILAEFFGLVADCTLSRLNHLLAKGRKFAKPFFTKLPQFEDEEYRA